MNAVRGKTDSDYDSDVSVSITSRVKEFERGDFCSLTSSIGRLNSGSEVMVSGIFRSNRSYVYVVDYRRNYYKVHEIHLYKIG